jgi:cbb3-type cytochrome oxidase subunit 3
MNTMDFGLMAVIIIYLGYCVFRYKKHKETADLVTIILLTGISLYGTKYPIYDRLQQSQQRILTIGFIVFSLILLFIGYKNKMKKKDKNHIK